MALTLVLCPLQSILLPELKLEGEETRMIFLRLIRSASITVMTHYLLSHLDVRVWENEDAVEAPPGRSTVTWLLLLYKEPKVSSRKPVTCLSCTPLFTQ